MIKDSKQHIFRESEPERSLRNALVPWNARYLTIWLRRKGTGRDAAALRTTRQLGDRGRQPHVGAAWRERRGQG